MGWVRCDEQPQSDGHEGYVLAVVRSEGQWRELATGDVAQDVSHVQIGCECGWRSPRQSAPIGAEFKPCMVFFDRCFCDAEAIEDAASAMWDQHMAEVDAAATVPLGEFDTQLTTRANALHRGKLLFGTRS